MVADLIDPNHQSWNIPLIQQHYDECIVSEVIKLPIRPLFASDQLIWAATKDGLHSVKSNYQSLISTALNKSDHAASSNVDENMDDAHRA